MKIPYKHGAFAIITGNMNYYRNQAEPVQPIDPTPAGMEPFIPAGDTAALITNDGAVFYCRKENE